MSSDEFRQTGVKGEVITQSIVSDKSKVTAALLSFFLGMFGVHRFYLGRVATGAMMLIGTMMGFILLGFFFIGVIFLVIIGIWDFIDFFRILFGSFTDSEGRKLK